MLKTIVLGIVQGLTEFLPVSSSGHLVLFQHIFHKGSAVAGDISLEVFLHLGTVMAVIIYFRRDIFYLAKSLFCWKNNLEQSKHKKNRTVLLYLIISSAVTGFIYLIFGDFIERIFSAPMVVALMLILTGNILFLSDLKTQTMIILPNLGIFRSIVIGIGQGVSMLPGISRSGTTIAAGLLTGVNRSDAARYSFLLSIPAILGANLNEFRTLINLTGAQFIEYLAGAIAAFVSGFLVISLLIRLVQNKKLKYFSCYCWLIALLSIGYILLQK